MKTTQRPLAILEGVRTPFCKAYGALADVHAMELGTAAVRGLLKKVSLPPESIDELVMGNVSGPADSANIARVIALKAGIPADRIAHTVNRNCASGMESVLEARQILNEGRAATIIAGGTESMSGIPLLVRPDAAKLLLRLQKAKSIGAKLSVLAKLRPKHLRPVVGVMQGLTDPVCGLNMGQTAEVLAKEFAITREEQDQFALESHRRAAAAQKRCFLSGEIVPMEGGPEKDDGPRPNQTLQALQKLRPIFDPNGTVTAGNSCPLTDGAAALIATAVDSPLLKDHRPLGYITHYAIAGLDPRRMGLGPVFATAKLLQQSGLQLNNFDLFEINEA
ncbi:MAG: thiolase family protein, partial [Planctomycetaceae bacterium]|nr:thiolase family protein [Planctomycetaceae bacterium]